MAMRALDIQSTYNYALPDQRLDGQTLAGIGDQIEWSMRDFKPQVVYTHWRDDVNQDHEAVHRAVNIACRPQSGVHTLLYFETEGTRNFQPNWFTPIDWDVKARALECYASEMREEPHPRSLVALSALAVLRGSQCGAMAAEGFMLGRTRC